MTSIEEALKYFEGPFSELGEREEGDYTEYKEMGKVILKAYREAEAMIKELKRSIAEHKVGCDASKWQPQKDSARIAVLEAAIKRAQQIECESICKLLSGMGPVHHSDNCVGYRKALSGGSHE